ncbi:MAG: hypothetical protein ACXWX1_09490 [Aeromicrobium sp.]
MAIGAVALLALVAKAKAVFESPGTFLSFPVVSPLTYRAEQLRFGGAGEMTTDDLNELSEFSRIVNCIPRSVFAPVDQLEYMWNVYNDVLQTAEVARGVLTSEEQARYEQAVALLYVKTADAGRSDSDVLRVYKQHRDASIAAQEAFTARQLSAESSDDPAVKDHWQTTEEPELRAAVDAVNTAWETEGHRAEVDAALAVEEAVAARSPARTWADWKTSFMKDIDTQTDSNQIQFAPTAYSPYDIFDDDWPRFTMSRSEITQMAATAPQELVEVLGTGDLGPIEEISFDFRSVAVTRPWFRSGVFTSRFWRLPAGMDALSDGAEEATGRCPAYVSAVVFARNISITSRPEAVDASPPDPRMLMLIDRAILAEKRPEMAAFISLPAPTPVAVTPTSMNLAARLSAVSFASRTAASPTAEAGTGPARPALRLAAFRQLVARPAVTDMGAVRLSLSSVRDHRTVRIDPGMVIAHTPDVPPPAPEPTVVATPPDEIRILAFICRRIPRSPDPDPQLLW